jgi:eukaryotic-like serine/threonine-protein kinase
MTTIAKCPQCGMVMTETAAGLCPACLIKQAMATATEAGAATAESPDPQTINPELGAKVRYFGDYELLGEIARGGMGVIYKARQASLNRIVALKMILSGQLATETQVKRFHTEAEAAANLQHPNIVAIHEVGEHEGQHYFSMDYVEGKSLADQVGGRPLPAQQAARYVQIIAEAVHFAHQHGTLHRDLKPQNVLIDEHDQPRITDFGLAKILGDESSLTMSGQVMGSPSYMAPEQAAGRHDQVGPHSDLYALGAILYELLAGRPPFKEPTIMATMQKVMTAEPAAPRSFRSGVPADVETICLKCLEKVPSRRYASAQELADDLDRFLRGERIRARPPGLLDRLDRWARLRPALAFTLLALAVFYLLHLVLLGRGTEGEAGFFHWFITGIVTTWAVAAMAFQRWMTNRPRSVLPIYCWAAFEVVMLTLFLWQGDGPRSALLIGYPLLIAGAALRYRLGLIWLVTGLSAASYIGLVIEASLRRPQFAGQFKDWVFFTLSLFVLGFVQRLLLRRLRAASPSEY